MFLEEVSRNRKADIVLGTWNVRSMYRAGLLTSGGKIEKNEMGGACGAYGGGERCAQGSGWET